MKRWFRSGRPWVWLTASSISISLLAMLAIIVLLAGQGMRYLWPQPVWLLTLPPEQGTQRALIGEIYAEQTLSRQQLEQADLTSASGDAETRYLIKIGQREIHGQSFRTLLSRDIIRFDKPADILVLKRTNNGTAYGYLAGMLEGEQPLVATDLPATLQHRVEQVQGLLAKTQAIRMGEMAKINQQFETLRLEEKKRQQAKTLDNQALARLQAERIELQRRFDALSRQLTSLNLDINRDTVQLRDANGSVHLIPLRDIEQAWFPNAMNLWEKISHWGEQAKFMLVHYSLDSNSAGHLFPAIFGTVLMVVLMSIVVMPLGVIAAVYLHEYAGKNSLTRWVRIAVVNLAGVPSIVYGVFGLGFFVYLIGGTLDQLFYSEALPNPTFGTPGLLWASLTLALLTLPVVIVATEEGLSRIPMSVRHGSLALGATKAETLWHVVLPMAVPAMMTGLILAVARAAGETAPLMLVGVVKSVPVLPVDDIFPYLHLERKFMHLGFQIYDLAFQSPDVEAARPLVYITALLLVLIVVGLNLAAIGIRHVLREKYRSLSL
ncbi:phosphate ABC transporter permease PstA [Pectobacterium quasiaquaticum]|uniref:Phosphate transport system permease protein PstA n=1 Tax=Pectobacterium quasiaquaticum TaxID=2774015 RepID=A0A9Q2EV66_9GAMM|nr:phosphate ABC transporter permease PstA [Pectobacterium quasiaquaticum]MBN3065382.1 phosphate ABC transporter permease PstA [Pectobacterium aquaticum]MBE5203929.1 phosphate ABC transporter permease PstA [Pectobacterium quasiaquaticum]MBE5209831.1 phosphate ABC transporter permease PstA [Pectobacterium quasiaquaticum]MBE5214072.1 phosphate ABC transporter permease PstA [Pectobacterium quasiaquaticum]MBE5222491.1 phosphate ABC transporter permease PstA [Pectobacterium quasiaquaticum]